MWIQSGDIDISNINRIDIVVGGDHGQGAFPFPIKILYKTWKYSTCGLRIMQERRWYNIAKYNNQRP